MTPDEYAFLLHVSSVEHTNSIRIFVMMGFYGIYLPLFLKSMMILTPRATLSTAARWLWILVAVLFTSTTVYIGAGISIYLVQIDWPTLDPSNTTVRAKANLVNVAANTPTRVFTIAQGINRALGDAIIIWRAVGLWQEILWVRIALIVSLLINIAFRFSCKVYNAIVAQTHSTYEINVLAKMDASADFASLAVNLLATAAVGVKAWKHRQMIKTLRVHTQSPKRSIVNKALLLLTEAGVFLALVQLISAIMDALSLAGDASDPRVIFAAVFSTALDIFAAIYPSLVAVLLTNQPSVVDDSIFCPGDEAPDSPVQRRIDEKLSTVKFASRPTASTQSGSGVYEVA